MVMGIKHFVSSVLDLFRHYVQQPHRVLRALSLDYTYTSHYGELKVYVVKCTDTFLHVKGSLSKKYIK